MIPLYSAATPPARLNPGLLTRLNLEVFEHWPHFQRAASTAECAVLLLECLGEEEALSRLARFRARFPAHPVVLVTRKDAENARRLKDVVVEEVVWLCEAEQRLASALHSVSGRGALQRLAAQLSGLEHLPPKLREALVQACRAERPPRNVQELAATVGRDRRTLSRLWSEAAVPDAALRLQDVVDWLVLLHALAQRRGGRKWSVVARELGVHEETLRRLALRLGGSPLAELAGSDAAAAEQRFGERLLQVLRRRSG